MNPKTIIVGIVGLLVASGTGLMMWKFLQSKQEAIKQDVIAAQQKVPPTIPTVRVLVAKSDLVVGTTVGRDNLHWQVWPTESVAPTYVVDGAKVADVGKSDEKKVTIEDFIGTVVRSPVAAGQPMVLGLVAAKGERGFLAAVLQPGMRAMSIGVNPISGISGFILPGDRVDILWDVKKSSKGYPFTQTLMSNVRVLAVDTKTQAAGATKAKTITLELTPHQAEALSLAQNMGTLEFVLRSIAPDKNEEKGLDGADDGLLTVAMGEGTQAGTLIGREIIRATREEEVVEITKDSYTLERDLLFGVRSNRGNRTPQPAPVQAASGGGGTAAGRKTKTSGNVIPVSGSSTKISIVRGTQTQLVKVK
jgi:pilus assembly protein CpaB